MLASLCCKLFLYITRIPRYFLTMIVPLAVVLPYLTVYLYFLALFRNFLLIVNLAMPLALVLAENVFPFTFRVSFFFFAGFL